MMKLKLILVLLSLISCRQDLKKSNLNKDSNKILAFFDASLKDTLELSKSAKVELKFNHVLKSNKKNNEYTLVDCCIVFTTKNKLEKYKSRFKSFCDTIYMPKVKVNDTAKFSLNYKPTVRGENIFLIKITEKTFLEPHKDSIRQIVNDYFFEKEFFVK